MTFLKLLLETAFHRSSEVVSSATGSIFGFDLRFEEFSWPMSVLNVFTPSIWPFFEDSPSSSGTRRK